MTQTLEEILAGYEGLRADQEAFYQDLHRHPELSHQEHDTAGRVAERLRGDGFTVQAGIGGTGVVGVLANGSGPTVLLRCELDALPVREDTGAPYASTVTAHDAQGHEVPVAHACGHDLLVSASRGNFLTTPALPLQHCAKQLPFPAQSHMRGVSWQELWQRSPSCHSLAGAC